MAEVELDDFLPTMGTGVLWLKRCKKKNVLERAQILESDRLVPLRSRVSRERGTRSDIEQEQEARLAVGKSQQKAEIFEVGGD